MLISIRRQVVECTFQAAARLVRTVLRRRGTVNWAHCRRPHRLPASSLGNRIRLNATARQREPPEHFCQSAHSGVIDGRGLLRRFNKASESILV